MSLSKSNNRSRMRNDKRGPARLATLMLGICLMLGSVGMTAQAADARNRQQAIDIAMRQNGAQGKVLGVQTIRSDNGQTFFAVKILSNGRVRVHRIRQAD